MASRYLFLLFASAVVSSPIDRYSIETVNISPRDLSPYRLPDAVDVTLYQIDLRLTEETFTTSPNSYEGTTKIIFRSLLNSNEIKLHANRLEFSSVTLIKRDGTEIGIADRSLNTTTEILTLSLEENVDFDEFYQLIFEFTGQLRTDGLNGFYRSSYVNSNNETRFLGTTQMEPTSARKAFPCFDEPSIKAEFEISIRHPVQYTAVGNTAGTRRTDQSDPNFVTTTFGVTPRMPTYLIAFVVSDFTCSRGEDIEPGIAHFVCSRNDYANDRGLANEYGPKITRAMEEFTGVKFSEARIGKIHQFAIPDFSAGAMENWGLITYREQYLHWNPQESSNRDKHNAITIIAHELAHFWFGNYVTCGWWSNIFLNEGFATYFEYTIPQIVDSTLETDKIFVLTELQPVLVSDASPNSAPLSSPANTQSEISNRFSTVSYSKGGSVFRMVEHIMGRENFKQGLNFYLTYYRFGNTRPENLWLALDLFSPVSLSTAMQNWVYRPGFPLLRVTTQGNNVIISQSRYLSTDAEPSPDDQWYVPISYSTSATLNKFHNTTPSVWLTPGNTATIPLANANDWIILNNQQTGYYRVDYDDNLWAKIRTALNRPSFDGIHEINRAQIVDDFYNFARYGRKSYTELLELYTFLRKDTSYYSWYAANAAFTVLTTATTNEELVRFLNAYILELMEVIYNTVPFNEVKEDDQIFTLTKTLIIPWACRLDFRDCADRAVAAFTRYRTTGEKLDKNLKATILCNGLRHSTDSTDWDFLFEEYLNTNLATERSTILTALGCSRNATILKEYLTKTISDDSGIRPQDAASVFSSVHGGGPGGVDVALDFLIENFSDIVNYYGTLNAVNNLFNGLATRFTRTEQTDKLRNFIDTTDLGNSANAATNALNNALNNLQRTTQLEEQLRSYFTQEEETEPNTVPPPPPPTTTPPPIQPNATTPKPTPDDDGSGSSSLAVGLTTFMATVIVLCYQFL